MSAFIDLLRRHCHEESNLLYAQLFQLLQKHNEILLLSNLAGANTCSTLRAIHNQPENASISPKTLILLQNPDFVEALSRIIRYTDPGLSVISIFPGFRKNQLVAELAKMPRIFIGTPARILDIVASQMIRISDFEAIIVEDLSGFQYLGYEDQLSEILETAADRCKIVMTSKSDETARFTRSARGNKLSINKLRLRFPFKYHAFTIIADEHGKYQALHQLISELFPNPVVVFCNHRGEVIRLAKYLQKMSVPVGVLHGGVDAQQFVDTPAMLRNGSLQVVITTDYTTVSDLPELLFLVHFNMPINKQAYDKRNQILLRHHHFGTAFHLLQEDEDQPEFIQTIPDIYEVSDASGQTTIPWWSTIKIEFQDKKVKFGLKEAVKLLTVHGRLHRDEIGLFENRNNAFFVAIASRKAPSVIERINGRSINKNTLQASLLQPLID